MYSLVPVIRARRRSRSKPRSIGILAKLAVWFLSILSLSLALILFGIAILYSDLIQDLPSIDGIQDWFSLSEDTFPSPDQVLDRSGEHLLITLTHPSADSKEWMQIESVISPTIPETVIDAAIAAQDETFWSHHGFDIKRVMGGILDALMGAEESELYRSIPQRLVYMTVLPAEDFSDHQLRRYVRSAVLAQNLVERYSREQILEWYLNSVRFGALTQGIDSASLVYFSKHAPDLSLAESAFLITLMERPDLDPERDFAELKERQGAILAKMATLGLVTTEEFAGALDEKLVVNQLIVTPELGLAKTAELKMFEALGLVISQRLGLQVHTTIDYDLQGEAQCVSQIYLDRLAGKVTLLSVDDLDSCRAASLLPPLRPGEIGIDHLANDAALVALDPQSGEILALYGDVLAVQSPGRMIYPLVYLSAFARGYSPGSMVLDLPTEFEAEGGMQDVRSSGNGPIRMRNALVGSYPYAAKRTLDLVGDDAFLQVVQQLGIRPESTNVNDAEDLISTSLLDLGYAYSVFANLGTMYGQSKGILVQMDSPSPILISSITDPTGAELHKITEASRSILSPALAYLMVDTLSDTSARLSIYGDNNVFNLDQPIAVVSEGEVDLTNESWAIGFTPSLVLGVRVGNAEGEEMYRMNPEIGAASLWQAMMELVISNTSFEGWEVPSEIVELEVCDPSGLLPTKYCPYSVPEIFIRGTEPSQYDTFYVPIKINKESGRLATMLTPANLVEEQVFFIPPPEARDWADLQGYPRPPNAYDAIRFDELTSTAVEIEFPTMFSYVQGTVRVRGRAVSDAFHYYRLQYGKGLNPTQWIVIGDDQFEPQERGLLTIWETNDLDGLYTLQLLVVDRDGKLNSNFVHVTIDNEPPLIELDKLSQQIKSMDSDGVEIMLIAQVEDNLGVNEVEFLVDGRVVGRDDLEPFVKTISLESVGEYEISGRAYDLAGNMGESQVQVVSIVAE